MSVLQVLPILAYLAICLCLILIVRKAGWGSTILVLAIAGTAFAGFSLLVVFREGPLQFWINHTTSLAGNQVWFDLLLAVTLAFYLIAPRARAVGMALVPWGVAVGLTASVALLPMLARLLWLERGASR
jgi:hypothetical protein